MNSNCFAIVFSGTIAMSVQISIYYGFKLVTSTFELSTPDVGLYSIVVLLHLLFKKKPRLQAER